MEFTRYSTLTYCCDTEIINNKVVIKEGYEGFEIREREGREGELFVYFKDIHISGNVVERFFIIKEQDMNKFIMLYNYYQNNVDKKYETLCDLLQQADVEGYQKVFDDNYLFFVAINVSLNEWKGMNGILEKTTTDRVA